MFLNIHSHDYDIITNVLNIWNVTNGRDDHILKLLSCSVDVRTKPLVPEEAKMSREFRNVPRVRVQQQLMIALI